MSSPELLCASEDGGRGIRCCVVPFMPKSIIRLFSILLVSCLVFMLCVYFRAIDENVSSRLGSLSAFGFSARSSGDSNRRLTGVTPTSPTAESQNFSIDAHSSNKSESKQPYQASPAVRHSSVINLALILSNVDQKPSLKFNFQRMMLSLLKRSPQNTTLHFHLVTDPNSQHFAHNVIAKEATDRNLSIKVQPYLIDKFVKQYGAIIRVMEKYFTYKPGSYYSQAIFFVSICLHDLLPKEVEELVFLDVDLEFRGSILELEHHFQDFDSLQMLGMAPELSPVYHHILYEYRKKHKKTLLGAPKGKGFPGYNSGVVLMKLDRLRTSDLYKTLTSNSSLASLTSKYYFRGHLGDQDFYTLVALEHPELFYTLPCNWNRQLCQWWKSKGYDDQFDDFYQCQGFINVYHGNCNSPIPAET